MTEETLQILIIASSRVGTHQTVFRLQKGLVHTSFAKAGAKKADLLPLPTPPTKYEDLTLDVLEQTDGFWCSKPDASQRYL